MLCKKVSDENLIGRQEKLILGDTEGLILTIFEDHVPLLVTHFLKGYYLLLFSLMLLFSGLHYIVTLKSCLLCVQEVRFINLLVSLAIVADSGVDGVYIRVVLAYLNSKFKITKIPDAIL